MHSLLSQYLDDLVRTFEADHCAILNSSRKDANGHSKRNFAQSLRTRSSSFPIKHPVYAE